MFKFSCKCTITTGKGKKKKQKPSAPFSPVDLWPLIDNKNFINRYLVIGICPNCEKHVVLLVETRKSDDECFKDEQWEEKAFKIQERCEKERSKVDFTVPTGGLNGFVYGKNTGWRNKQGEITTAKQYSSDWWGNTALVRTKRFNKH